jgi:UDP-N-acetylglucosamine 2-epimerase (non-hydrolysing)
MKKVLLVFGTRPEAIKMAPLYHALVQSSDFEPTICVTAQHREMLDQVLDTFRIRPDIDLDLMKHGQDQVDVTCAVLSGIRNVLKQSRPDILLVHGDTTTSVAASIAGFHAGVPIGHIEAGLRTYNLASPYPEEFNRQVTTKVSRWHFAPTQLSRQNLLGEGVNSGSIFVTGNTVIDALLWALRQLEATPERADKLKEFLSGQLMFPWQDQPFVLITGHRRENFGIGFHQVCQALRELAIAYPEVKFVYPVHLNPNVREPVGELLVGLSNIRLIEPLAYEPFLLLLAGCQLVLTDSGGIQEEAPSLGKPVLVMRDVTERPEAVDAGTVKLVGTDRDRIVTEVSNLLSSSAAYSKMAKAHNPYGDGMASERIVEFLKEAQIVG